MRTTTMLVAPLVIMVLLNLQAIAISQQAGMAVPGYNIPRENLENARWTHEYAVSYRWGPDTMFAVGLIVAAIALAAVVGIRVLGTGLSGTTVEIIWKSVLLYIMWGFLSVGALAVLTTIPFDAGVAIYIMMTVIYTIGVISTVRGGGD